MTLTWSKTLSSSRSARRGLADTLGPLNVINLAAVFQRIWILCVTVLSHKAQICAAYLTCEAKIAWYTLRRNLVGTYNDEF